MVEGFDSVGKSKDSQLAAAAAASNRLLAVDEVMKGCLTAIVTPMNDDESKSVNYDALRNLIQFQIDNKTQGIVGIGTTGESPTIDEDEFTKLLSFIVSEVAEYSKGKKKIPVIAGTGTNNTKTTIERTLKAKSLGVDAALVVTPYYNKPTQAGLIEHFSRIAIECSDVPLILYNVPSRTSTDLKPSTLEVLSQFPNIIGIKEASADLNRFIELDKLKEKSGLKIFSGDDSLTVPAVIAGLAIDGVVSVTANLIPSVVQAAFETARDPAKRKKAEILHEKLLPLHEGLFIEPNPTAVKFLLAEEGLIPKGIRLPLLPLSLDKRVNLSNIYKSVKEEITSLVDS